VQIPSKRECFYILEMLESGLIDYSYLVPWADRIITGLKSAPPWLGTLAMKRYTGDLRDALREYVLSEPFEPWPGDIEKFHVACLWLRYKRRELSWATFLRLAGERLDAANGDWDCETPYHYRNVYEDAYFTRESEEQTKEDYLADHDLRSWIALAKEKFEPLRQLRWADKANPSEERDP